MRYIVATVKPWNIKAYHDIISHYPGEWTLVTSPDELVRLARADKAALPDYIFFPHWSHIVSDWFTENTCCVCFHETELPYGRGGSPIQNLIVRNHTETVISAIKMTGELDAGPILLQRPLSLLGTAEEIFIRSSKVVAEMIGEIIKGNYTLTPQQGEITTFKRRKPEQSEITPEITTLADLFDHIRMLDAESYPNAFVKVGKFRLEFSRATLRTGYIQADARIVEDD